MEGSSTAQFEVAEAAHGPKMWSKPGPGQKPRSPGPSRRQDRQEVGPMTNWAGSYQRLHHRHMLMDMTGIKASLA